MGPQASAGYLLHPIWVSDSGRPDTGHALAGIGLGIAASLALAALAA